MISAEILAQQRAAIKRVKIFLIMVVVLMSL
jgi:hypothetical protein